MSLLERALLIAVQAHQGQKDKGGTPYILHPLRMMLAMDTKEKMIAAILHDVIEDTDWTFEELSKEGFPEEVLQAVDCLTRRDDESYRDFIRRVKSNPMARSIKIADIEENMNIKRISKLTEKDMKRMKKYHQAWKTLTGNENR